MVLDALFLLPDSDRPNEELRDKVRQSNKWIWWQGKVQLKGQPPGLRQLPKAQVIAEIAEKTREITVPKVVVRKEKVEEQEQEKQDSVAVGKSPVAQREIPAVTASSDVGTVRSQEAVQTASVTCASVAAAQVVVGKEKASAGLGAGAQRRRGGVAGPNRFSLL